MNLLLFFILLLLAVPMQLLLNYIIRSTETGANLQDGAFDRISGKVESLYDDIHSTVKYYSKLRHLKELFVIPHKQKKVKQTNLKETIRTYVDPATGMQVTTIVLGSGFDDDNDDNEDNEGREHTKTKESGAGKQPGIDRGSSVAWEVEEWNQKHLYYARSEAMREVHPPRVKFFVGEIVEHRQDHYYGVIVGWDEKCQASHKWLKSHGYYQSSDKALQEDPHYLILVKHSESGQSELYYLPERHLQAKFDAQLDHQDLYHYFESYDKEEQKFVPRPWLKERYPKG